MTAPAGYSPSPAGAPRKDPAPRKEQEMHIGTTAQTPALEVSVLIGGTPQPLYRRPGDGKIFVAGIPGSAYTLRARNRTAGRIEVVSTVDGRNTLRDEPGDVHACTGLVFAAHATGEFTGWRVSDSQTREFIFGTPEHSVAAQAAGSAANTGVIGFAVYREREHVFYGRLGLRGAGLGYGAVAAASATFDSADSEPVSRSGLGTGIGERREDHVGHTSFTRAIGEPELLVIGYDTEAALREMGILGPREPDPFPGAGTGYERYPSTR